MGIMVKRQIAFVMNTMNVGGIEKVLTVLLNNIDYGRYEVDLWLRNPGGKMFSRINSNVSMNYWGISDTRQELIEQIKQGKKYTVVRGIVYRVLLRLYKKDWVINEIYAAKAQELCTAKEYDCVIAYQGISASVIATSLYRLKSEKKIAWIHGEDAFLARQIPKMRKEYSKFDKIFCVSESTKKQYINKYIGLDGKASVAYNLIDMQEIKNKAQKQVEELEVFSLVTVGRLSKLKGQQMVPAVVRMLLDAGYDVFWYLVGDGPLREEIEAEIRKHNVTDRVILLGTKENPYPYMKNCDIYVQPSFSEGYCTTTMEAKILCKPIVTTDAPGMREQFTSGENGLIVDAMTPEALFEGIRTLLDRPELCRKFEENLKRESFDDAANEKELQKLYDFIES